MIVWAVNLRHSMLVEPSRQLCAFCFQYWFQRWKQSRWLDPQTGPEQSWQDNLRLDSEYRYQGRWWKCNQISWKPFYVKVKRLQPVEISLGLTLEHQYTHAFNVTKVVYPLSCMFIIHACRLTHCKHASEPFKDASHSQMHNTNLNETIPKGRHLMYQRKRSG